MNPEKFTQKSLEAIQEAQSVAIRNQNGSIEQAHLMLSLIHIFASGSSFYCCRPAP